MSNSDRDKTEDLKEEIQKEINELLKKLDAGKITRIELDGALRKVQETVERIPPHLP